MAPLIGAAAPIVKMILAWLAAEGVMKGAGAVARKAFPTVTKAALSKGFAGSGAGKMLGAGLGKAASASPAWLAKRMPTAEGLASGTLGGLGSAAHLGGLFGTAGVIEDLLSGSLDDPASWQGIDPVSPEYRRQEGELDQYAQMQAMQDAINQYINSNRRVV